MGHASPSPEGATTPEHFVEEMRLLKAWSGQSYRTLAKRASDLGKSLPHSTIATVLNQSCLPREDFVAAFAEACGCDGAAVAVWVGERRRLAVESARRSEGPAEPEPAARIDDDALTASEPDLPETTEPIPVPAPRIPPVPSISRRGRVRRHSAVTVLLMALSAAVTAVVLMNARGPDTDSAAPPKASSLPSAPAPYGSAPPATRSEPSRRASGTKPTDDSDPKPTSRPADRSGTTPSKPTPSKPPPGETPTGELPEPYSPVTPSADSGPGTNGAQAGWKNCEYDHPIVPCH
ncbi:helix-turn-helix domain-containing protein [Actinomadura decatromicini]|uniref:Helix-turn-helix domain-containing protein n=1 Tax=Actinomadura decatromicini TaxID=2604572 RepID=A0A5D3FCW4_9ACTN|nr:helix-turn-helix domain-containing protein [Actinomadura decatromicini]TYK46013.1 hypothetical protein FXF68_27775 [Actinomadura decatromicini]